MTNQNPTPEEERQHFAKIASRRAPVQGYIQGIPWEMHLRAYDAYCAKYSPQKALIQGGCRGGFSVGELDVFIPGWRDEISLIAKLEARADAAEAESARLREALTGLEAAARSMVVGVSIHNERKQYGPITGAVPDALARRVTDARAALATTPGEQS